jgi:hypothetical protein
MSAQQIWAFVLTNGQPSQSALLDAQANTQALLANPSGWQTVLEPPYTAADLLKLIAAVYFGKRRITTQGDGHAHVEFDAIDGSHVAVSGEVTACERTSVTHTP